MAKLRRLKINRYRNVAPGCELTFNDGLNVLLGPNGGGKTTLLALISAVLRSDFTEIIDPFSLEFELSLGEATIKGSVEGDGPLSKTPDIGPPDIDFELLLEANGRRVDLTRRKGHLSAVREGQQITLPVPATGRSGMIGQLLFATQFEPAYGLSRPGTPERFDESLEMFEGITARAGMRSDNFTERVRPQFSIVLHRNTNPPIASWMPSGLIPRQVYAAAQAMHEAFTKSQDLEFEHPNVRFLSEGVRLLRLKSARARLELVHKGLTLGEPSPYYVYSNLNLFFTRHDGSLFTASELSYGQKRLIAFLYYLDCTLDFVIADELVNGFHHTWIKECLDAVQDRQAFLTSQNPLLLDYMWFESKEQVKACFVSCRPVELNNQETLEWRNLLEDEVDMFYSAYQVGVERVGEILRLRGMW